MQNFGCYNTSVSLIHCLFHYMKGQLRTESGQMARVTYTHLVESTRSGTWGWGTILSGRTGSVHVLEDASEG
jgi:hypothetical protein